MMRLGRAQANYNSRLTLLTAKGAK